MQRVTISLIASSLLVAAFASEEVVSIGYKGSLVKKTIIETDTGIVEDKITIENCSSNNLNEIGLFKYEEDTQKIIFTSIHKKCLKSYSNSIPKPLKLEKGSKPSVYTNYAVRSDSNDNKMVNVGVGGNKNGMHYYTDGVYNAPAEGKEFFKRGSTYIGFDNPDSLTRIRVGDINGVTNSPIQGVFGFGMQVSKRFDFAGMSPYGGGTNNAEIVLSTDSRVIVKLDGVTLREENRPAGIYSMSQIAQNLPSGDYDLEVTDSFGKVSVFRVPYFFSIANLTVGQFDWSIAAAKKRVGQTDRQDTYEEFGAAGYVKYGLYEWLTIGAHANDNEFAASATVGKGLFGLTGYYGNNLLSADLTFQVANGVTVSGGMAKRTDILTNDETTSYTARINAYGLSAYGRFNDIGVEKGLSYSTSLLKKGTLTVNAYETVDKNKIASVNLIFPLDFGRNQATANVMRNYANEIASTDFVASTFAKDEGFSGNVRISRPDDLSGASANARLRYDGVNNVEMEITKNPNTERYLAATLSGSVACVDGRCGIGKPINSEEGFVLAEGSFTEATGVLRTRGFRANSNQTILVGEGMIKTQKEMALRVGEGYLVKPKKAVFGNLELNGKPFKGSFKADGEEVLTNTWGDFMIETENDEVVVEFNGKTQTIKSVDEDIELKF